MWTYALLAVFVAIAIGFSLPDRGDAARGGEQQARVQADNFAIYRGAVLQYAAGHPGYLGTVPDSSLSLEPSFVNTGPWTNSINNGKVIVYGPLPYPGAISLFAAAAQGTYSVGINQSGTLVSPVFGNVEPVPAWVPNNNVVSIISVN